MADQEFKIEKEPVSGFSSESGAEKKEMNFENISNPESNFEKKEDFEKRKEVLESIKKSDEIEKNDSMVSEESVEIHAKDISLIKDIEQQIEKIVQLAVQKDPYVAIKVAKHLDENYILDQVHDKLREDEVRKILIDKKLLENI